MSWLEGLNVDDEVVVHARRGSSIAKVSRITKTQIVVGDTRFSRSTGCKCGNDMYSYANLAPVTDQVRNNFLLNKKLKLAKACIDRIQLPQDLDGLNKLIEVITPYVRKES